MEKILARYAPWKKHPGQVPHHFSLTCRFFLRSKGWKSGARGRPAAWGRTGHPGLSFCLPLAVMSFRRHHSIGGKTVGQTWIGFGFQCKKKHFFYSFFLSLLREISKKLKTFIPSPFSKPGQIKKQGGLFMSKYFPYFFLTFSLFSSGTKSEEGFFPECLGFFCKVKQN